MGALAGEIREMIGQFGEVRWSPGGYLRKRTFPDAGALGELRQLPGTAGTDFDLAPIRCQPIGEGLSHLT